MHVKHLALLTVSLWACGPSTQAPTPQPSQFPPREEPTVDLDALLADLSPRDKIAQLVVPWIAGTYTSFDDDAFRRMQEWVDSLHIGGLLVSVGSPLDEAAKLNRLQQRSRLPLLIASDLEAGTSIRLNGGTPFPPNMGVAATGSDSDAYELGRITALEGRAVGHSPRLCTRSGRQQQSRQPDHQHPFLWRGPAGGGPSGGSGDPRHPGTWHAGGSQTLPRPWRHRDRLAHHACGQQCRLGPARFGRAGAIPKRHRCRSVVHHVCSHRHARHRWRAAAAR